jgi:hypothetical protein
MRNATKRKSKAALSALAAAGLSAWAGAPAARGTFNVEVYNMGIQTDGGNSFQVWTLAATNNGLLGTGSTLSAVDVVIDTGGPSTFNSTTGALGIDIEKVSGAGATAKYSANIDGVTPDSTGFNASFQGAAADPAFGDVVGGTFVGVGAGDFDPNFMTDANGQNNGGQITYGASISSNAGIGSDLVNGQTSDYLISGNVSANYRLDFLAGVTTSTAAPTLDTGFQNMVGTVGHVNFGTANGALLNGTVHSLEIGAFAGTTSTPAFVPDTDTPGVPFANIVVPVGTVVTVHGQLAGESGGTQVFANIILGGSITPPSSSLTISLTGTGTNLNSIGTVTMLGTNGSYVPKTAAPAGVQQTTATLTIKDGAGSDFNSTTPPHFQIIGLDATGATSLTVLEADLAAALQGTNAGATVGNASNSILLANGDNVEIDLPASSLPNVDPEVLSYDLSNYTSNGTVAISQITVVPEPTSIGALALGGLGLLSRRRRKAKA